MFEKCPCGAGASYLTCCAPLHLGQRAAASPEQLMRSRYSAFARRDAAVPRVVPRAQPRQAPPEAPVRCFGAHQWRAKFVSFSQQCFVAGRNDARMFLEDVALNQ